ncbi:MAG: hypothetical protein KDE59_20185, partial [Anaerolineales bacterium]|nr:hypothetical protein [Anaerolineales bacterium]
PGLNQLLLTLLPAGLIGWPLWRYLQLNPAAEARLGQLSAPLRAAGQGDFSLLWQSLRGSLALFSLAGDGVWRYNLAGRPWLGPTASLLFVVGLLLAFWYFWRRDQRYGAGALLALGLLVIGLAPAAITGPELATTQAIGLLPVLYLLPALALAAGRRWLGARWPGSERWQPWLIGGGFLLLAAGSSQAYFGDWANRPEVRLQYESTLVAMLEELAATGERGAAISTAQPGPFHGQAVAALLQAEDPGRHFWFDGRHSLVLPAPGAPLLTAGLAPLHPVLIGLFVPGGPSGEIPTRASDLDRPIRRYEASAIQSIPADWQPAEAAYQFGDAVQLLGYWLATDRVAPGEVVPFLTGWQVVEPPAEDWVLFTHLTGPNGVPLAQQDLLGVPSAGWQRGEVFYQLHELVLPGDLPAGRYQLRSGFYYCPADCQQGSIRLPVSLAGATLNDSLIVTELEVAP